MYKSFGVLVALLAMNGSVAAQSAAVQNTAQAVCNLPKIADSAALDPVPGSDLMTVPVAINGKSKQFLLDVGTGPTELSQATVDQLGVPEDRKGEQRFQIDTFDSGYSGQFKRTGPSEIDAPIIQAGVAGSQLAARRRVRVDSFTIGRATGRNLSFAIAKDTELGKSKPYDGLLTNGFFKQYDMEVDFAGNKIYYLTPTQCTNVDKLIYWAHSEVATIPITILPDGKVTVQVTINGHAIDAVIDTSSAQTVMRRGIAEQMLGLRADTPQMQPDGDLEDGMGQQVYKTTFSQIAFQGVVASNVPALIETNSMIPNLHRTPELGSRARFSSEAQIPALTLGMDVLGQLHLYFAFGENVLYVTSAE